MKKFHLKKMTLLATLLSAAAGAQEAPPTEAPPAIAPKQFSGIRGVLKDAKTGEPLIAATVRVTKGSTLTAETDVDGSYVLPLPPGSYDLRFWYDGYEGKDVVGARVVENTTTNIKISLAPLEALVADEVVVTAKIDERKEETVLQDRKARATVSDALSAQEMSRAPDSNASDAVKRVVGATVTKENGVALRGLSGRYAATLVNGVALPSADPDGHQAPIDLLPTGMLANLTVQKSYGADMPGSFAGGALSMETNQFPSELEIKAKLSTGANSITTFRDRPSHAGGSLDFLGLDDGSRRLPAAVPTNGPLTSAAATEIASGFGDTWMGAATRGLPNMGVGVQVGNTHALGGDSKLGYLASVGIGHDESSRSERDLQPDITGSMDTVRHDLRIARGEQAGKINGLLNLGLSAGASHDVGLLTMYTRSGETVTEVAHGTETNSVDPYVATRLKFEQRSLLFNQLRGFHRLAQGDAGFIKWQANYALTQAEEPNTRDVKYSVLADGRERFFSESGSGERFFMNLQDHAYGASAEYRHAISRVNFQTGLSAQRSERQFDARRFRYVLRNSATLEDLFLPADELFNGDRVSRNFNLREDTRPTDSYSGDMGVYGAFGTVDLKLTDALRAVAGLRYELSSQAITSDNSPFSRQTMPARSWSRNDHSLLPTANLIYALTSNQNLRGGYSYTAVRPQFRELAPVLFTDYARRRTVTGNPELELTRIHNADLRWEWFPRMTEVLAASVFYKQFQNPIELAIIDFEGSRAYRNTPGAWSAGVELEGRVGLERFTPKLRGLRLGANLALIRSEVDLGAEQQQATSARRPLQGQAPWVLNALVGYAREDLGLDLNLLYNVSGSTLSEAGSNGVPDAYERSFHSVDVSASKQLTRGVSLKLAARNLLNQPVVIEQAGVQSLHYFPGVSGSLAVEWSL